MDSLFGLSMDVLLIVMLVSLGIVLSTVVWIFVRQRIMFLIGLRNIPRRVAQTVLIVLGLMLSTLIITAAFATGDTVDHSITNEVLRVMGHVDEILDTEAQGGAPAPDVGIPQATFDELVQRVNGDPNVDGFMPVVLEAVPVISRIDDLTTRLSSPQAAFIGLDETRMDAFPDVLARDGEQLDLTSLEMDEVYVNESLANEIDVAPGDVITVKYEGQKIPFAVKDIAQDTGMTGSLGAGQSDGLVTRLSTLQALTNRPGELDLIGVSNTGGVRDGVEHSDAVVEHLEQVIDDANLGLSVEPFKKDGLKGAELAGAGLMAFFLVFGSFSIAAGVLLIVMIFVMLAAERKSEMGMARALGTKRWHLIQMFLSEGMGYNLASALVGSALGVLVAFGLAAALEAIFAGSDFAFAIEPYVSLRSLTIAFSLGIVLTFVTVAFSSWRVSRLNIVRAIRDLPEPERKPGRRTAVAVVLLAIAGSLFVLLGISSGYAFPYALGFSLASFSAAMFARWLGLPERPVFTFMGLFLIVFWLLSAGQRIPGPSEGDIEMFILSGVVMVASASYVLVYNADLLLAVVSAAGDRLGRLLPAVKTAVAYPMANKFRTGMTLAMIAIVVFALNMMSVMNANFGRLFLTEEALGSWDVEVTENPNNPLDGGLERALAMAEVDTGRIADVGTIGVGRQFGSQLCQPSEHEDGCASPDDFADYPVKGADEPFLTTTTLPFQARAIGYETDEQVWEALAKDPNLAIIDLAALGEEGFSFGGQSDLFTLEGVDFEATEFEPKDVAVRDSATGATATVRIIGVLQLGASGGDPYSSFAGLITSEGVVNQVFGQKEFSTYYARLLDPDEATPVARSIEAALLEEGVQAESLLAERKAEGRLFNGFFYLMQAFAGLGLVVGVAAVGVIAFRSIVERRQQIGMLRAIGYTRGTVAASFLIESAFITLLGIVTGVVLALALGYFLLTSEEFSATGLKEVFIPWDRVIAVSAFAFIASLVMTFIPSRQAASIPIAEALRYE